MNPWELFNSPMCVCVELTEQFVFTGHFVLYCETEGVPSLGKTMSLFFSVSSETNAQAVVLVVTHGGTVCNSKIWKGKWSHSVLSDSATTWTLAYHAPLSMEFSRWEYWRAWPFPSPGDLPNPGIEPGSPSSQAVALSSEPQENIPKERRHALESVP